MLGIAELLEQLQRPPGVGGLLAPAGLDQRPIERIARVRQRTELADRLGFGDGLAARRDRLRPATLAVADPAEVGPDLRPARHRIGTPDAVRPPEPSLQPADGGRQRRAPLGDLAVAVAYPRLGDRVVAQQPARLRQRLRRRLRLPHRSQGLAELLPGVGQRARVGGEPIRATRIDRPPIQLRGVRVRETLGRPARRDHRVAVGAHVISRQREVL